MVRGEEPFDRMKGPKEMLFSVAILTMVLVVLSATMHPQDRSNWPRGDSSQIALVAFHPLTGSASQKKKPLTEKELQSGAFQKLQQVTGAGILDLRMLYETSGAEDFKEFSRALLVARNVRLDPQLILRALYEKSLEEILQEFGMPGSQAKKAIKIAKEQLEDADKEWKRIGSLPTRNALE